MASDTATFTVTVKAAVPPPNPLTLTPNGGALPDETVGVAVAGDLVTTVSGGTLPYKFAISAGSLPPGMGLASTPNPDGSEAITIEGTPTQAGSGSFDLTVTDAMGATKTAKVSVA